tara:strand:+ start:2577 stop:2792 length:216 start_codon:yes stop_codon:yes gene_type:complete
MTKPLRHTQNEIQCAAKAAKEFGLRVTLGIDGSITMQPIDEAPKAIKAGPFHIPKDLSGWLDNEGEHHGDS